MDKTVLIVGIVAVALIIVFVSISSAKSNAMIAKYSLLNQALKNKSDLANAQSQKFSAIMNGSASILNSISNIWSSQKGGSS